MTTRIQVHVNREGGTTLAGTAFLTPRRDSTPTTFTYEEAYLRSGGYAIDPTLPLVPGPQPAPHLPGVFQDCSPDRWGRNLIAKRRRTESLNSARRLPDLTDVDFLLGVSDATRQGALRFSTDGAEFLDPDTRVPKLIRLPHLLRATEQVDDNENAVKELLDAGSGSLGGARPKASVLGDGGQLLLAKFPHQGDQWDVMAWEKTALDLAERAGIAVPARRLVPVEGRHVLLLGRFDRADNGSRIGYLSAMSLVGGRDGEGYDYEDVADALAEQSPATRADLEELFRRAVFSAAIHNTDDHLRNHGFLYLNGGWALSPVFDINPNPNLAEKRQTSISGASAQDDEADGLEVFAQSCRLSRDRARDIQDEVQEAIRSWPDVARSNRVLEAEISLMSDAFRLPERSGQTHRIATRAPQSSNGPQGRRPKGPGGGQFTAASKGEPSSGLS